MEDHDAPVDEASQVISSARAAEHAIQHLCRTTLSRPSMTPAEVDVVLAHLADAVAALPQAARQLGDILAQARQDHVLEMDTLTETQDPDLAVETARLHRHGGPRTRAREPGRSGLPLGRSSSAGGPATVTYWFGWNLVRSSAVTAGRPSGGAHGWPSGHPMGRFRIRMLSSVNTTIAPAASSSAT